jgi:hypothetical protein
MLSSWPQCDTAGRRHKPISRHSLARFAGGRTDAADPLPRGMAKAVDGRLQKSARSVFTSKMKEAIPPELQAALKPLLSQHPRFE